MQKSDRLPDSSLLKVCVPPESTSPTSPTLKDSHGSPASPASSSEASAETKNTTMADNGFTMAKPWIQMKSSPKANGPNVADVLSKICPPAVDCPIASIIKTPSSGPNRDIRNMEEMLNNMEKGCENKTVTSGQDGSKESLRCVELCHLDQLSDGDVQRDVV